MQLTIKELAPYLPYDIQVQWLREGDNQLITSHLGISDYPFLIYKKKGKPLLLPLSHLTKEIEHNGERFVPIERLNNHIEHTLLEIEIRDDDLYFTQNGTVFASLEEIKEVYDMLFEWHFDTQNLIENNLAIDKTQIT